jgi:hypothetical protein
MCREHSRSSIFYRSYIVTLGLTFIAACLFIWQHEPSATNTAWPALRLALFPAFLLSGSAFILFGLLGPSSRMESWADVLSRHEASLIVMAIAYPVYLVISPFYNRH